MNTYTELNDQVSLLEPIEEHVQTIEETSFHAPWLSKYFTHNKNATSLR